MTLTPIEKQQLTDALKHFGVYFEPLQWIALQASGREINYLFHHSGDDAVLKPIPDDFAFPDAFSDRNAFMKVLGSREYLNDTCFAVVGGAPSQGQQDKMILAFPCKSWIRLSPMPIVRLIVCAMPLQKKAS